MDVSTYPQPLLITDANVNISPSLADKRDILQNAIDLALNLKIDTSRVAILPNNDQINSNLNTSLEAATTAC